MSEKQIMKCGCAATGVRGADDTPVCITHDCDEPAETQPDLSGRVALCSYRGCKHNAAQSRRQMRGGNSLYGSIPKGKDRSEAPSAPDLPFFEHRPDSDYDRFYCGCFGWS